MTFYAELVGIIVLPFFAALVYGSWLYANDRQREWEQRRDRRLTDEDANDNQ
jgi:hypothetical protein